MVIMTYQTLSPGKYWKLFRATLSTALNYFRKGASVSVLSLKELTLKLTFFLTLLSGQRCQTVKLFSIKNMERNLSKSCGYPPQTG